MIDPAEDYREDLAEILFMMYYTGESLTDPELHQLLCEEWARVRR